MADFNNIIQEINTNIPDNNTQAITAAKLRTTLIDLTNTIEQQQDSFETQIEGNISSYAVFSTDEQISQIGIDDTELKNPSENYLAKADDTMKLKYSIKLNNLELEETKVDLSQLTILNGYVYWNTGVLTSTSGLARSADIPIPSGATYVRFMGIKYAAAPNAGFVFYDSTNNVIQAHRYEFSSSQSVSSTLLEYIVEIPPTAVTFRTNVGGLGTGDILTSAFYCYFSYKPVTEDIGVYSKNIKETTKQLKLENGLLLSNGSLYYNLSYNPETLTKRVISKWIFVNGKATLNFTNGINYNIYYYKTNDQNSYVKNTGVWNTASSYEVDWIGYLCIVFKNTSGTVINQESFSATITYNSKNSAEQNFFDTEFEDAVTISVAGLKLSNLNIQEIGTQPFAHNQSFLIYNGNYYILRPDSNTNNLAICDSSLTLISQQHLAVGHGNAFQLGLNGKAWVSGWDDNKVYKVDLANKTIDTTYTLPVSGYTTVAVDEKNNLFYIFWRTTSPSTIETYTFTVYNYSTNTTVLTKQIEDFAYMQGVDFIDGKIFMAWGYPPNNVPSGMRVYNTNGDVMFDINIKTFENEEPEDIFIDRTTKETYVSSSTKIYKIVN